MTLRNALVVIGLIFSSGVTSATAIALADGASPSFAFASDESGATFQCSLDGAAPSDCTSPQSYTTLSAGHQVLASDPTHPQSAYGPDATSATTQQFTTAAPASFSGNVIYTVSRANSNNLKAYQSGTWTLLGHWTVPALEQQAYSQGFMTTVRGIAYDNGTLFVSAGNYNKQSSGTSGQLVAWDLVNNKQLWAKTYADAVDQPAACNGYVYMPTGEGTTSTAWHVISESTGAVVGSINGPSAGAHNTICNKDSSGKYHVFLGGRCLKGGRGCAPWYLGQKVCNGAVCTAGPNVGPGLGSKGVRPFTVGKNDTRAWITWTNYRGFSVGDLSTGKILSSVNFGSVSACGGISAVSHGISVSPDNTEVYVLDAGQNQVRVYSAADSPGSSPLAIINIDGFCGATESSTYCGGPDCTPDGWLQHTLDGQYVLVGSSGDVINTSTRQLAVSKTSTGSALQLYTDMRGAEHGFIVVNWSSGIPVAGSHYGVGN